MPVANGEARPHRSAIGKPDADRRIGDPVNPSPTLESVFQELDRLVGMEQAKAQFRSLINHVKIQTERERRGLKRTNLSLHVVLTGPPGTGKTTFARLLGEAYFALGLSKLPTIFETDRSGLVGQYHGHTAQKVDAVVMKADGGVLFIDEAYALNSPTSGASDPFGQEAVDLLLKRMEDRRDSLAVVLAGYPEEMERFLGTNPGLRSRFNRFIRFDHYEPQELVAIFCALCREAQYDLSPKGLTQLHSVLDAAWAVRTRDFGNGRFARNLFEQSVQRQADRLANRGASTMTVSAMQRLLAQDIEGALAEPDENVSEIVDGELGMPQEVVGVPFAAVQPPTVAVHPSHAADLGRSINILKAQGAAAKAAGDVATAQGHSTMIHILSQVQKGGHLDVALAAAMPTGTPPATVASWRQLIADHLTSIGMSVPPPPPPPPPPSAQAAPLGPPVASSQDAAAILRERGDDWPGRYFLRLLADGLDRVDRGDIWAPAGGKGVELMVYHAPRFWSHVGTAVAEIYLDAEANPESLAAFAEAAVGEYYYLAWTKTFGYPFEGVALACHAVSDAVRQATIAMRSAVANGQTSGTYPFAMGLTDAALTMRWSVKGD